MSATAMLGLWMWWTGSLKRVLNMPPLAVVAALMLAFLLTRSAGAFVYFAIGGAILMCVYYTKQRWPLLLLVGSIALFLLVRGSGSWDAKPIIDLAGRVFGEERAASIEIRVRNDSMMAEKAREQLMFGWGGWGRFRVTDAKGRDVSVTDSMWTIQFGTRGLVGLVCVFGIHLLPILLLIYRFPPRLWQHPLISPTIGLAVLVAMYMLDCLLNWMPNPIFTMTAGAVAGLRMPTPVLIRVPVSNENLTTTKSYVY